jgi:hypothetical protein
MAWLLLFLVELFRELLDLLTLSLTVAHGVMHQASRVIIIATGHLMGALVTSWATAPTNRCNSSCGSGSTSQWLVVAASLFLVVVLIFVATSLSYGTRIWLAGLPHL